MTNCAPEVLAAQAQRRVTSSLYRRVVNQDKTLKLSAGKIQNKTDTLVNSFHVLIEV